MSYEAAPATRLLATHCAVCCRPLLDAASVEMGIGPDCRKKYMPKALGGPAREEANKIVHQLALAISAQRGAISDSLGQDAAQVAYTIGGASAVVDMLVADRPEGRMLARLRDLGFEKLAGKLEAAWISIRITDTPSGRMAVATPFNERAVDAMRAIPGRDWDRDAKVNTFPANQRNAVWALLQAYYPGAAGVGPKGFFLVPTPRSTTIGARAAMAEAEMHALEAAGDYAQTVRDEAAKHCARRAMEA